MNARLMRMSIEIPKDKVISEKKCGKKAVSIRRKYINSLNQICCLDSNYEYDYALYLDYLYDNGEIAGWIKNTTLFGFSEEIETRGRKQKSYRPDFIIFFKNGTYEIHEVKGWMNERSETVLKQFKKDYENLTLKVIGKDEILSLQRNFKDKLWGWVEIR